MKKAWTLSVLFGIIGMILSGAIFFGIMYATEMIFGFVAIGCGMLSGGLAALGFKLGKGDFKSQKEITIFLSLLTVFGLLGVISGYFAPYFYFLIRNGMLINLSFYLSLIEFGFMDIIFALIGAYGGRYIGKIVVRSALLRMIEQHRAQKV